MLSLARLLCATAVSLHFLHLNSMLSCTGYTSFAAGISYLPKYPYAVVLSAFLWAAIATLVLIFKIPGDFELHGDHRSLPAALTSTNPVLGSSSSSFSRLCWVVS